MDPPRSAAVEVEEDEACKHVNEKVGHRQQQPALDTLYRGEERRGEVAGGAREERGPLPREKRGVALRSYTILSRGLIPEKEPMRDVVVVNGAKGASTWLGERDDRGRLAGMRKGGMESSTRVAGENGGPRLVVGKRRGEGSWTSGREEAGRMAGPRLGQGRDRSWEGCPRLLSFWTRKPCGSLHSSWSWQEKQASQGAVAGRKGETRV
ncbi:unnamed protein product [Calypogeia fissa]